MDFSDVIEQSLRYLAPMPANQIALTSNFVANGTSLALDATNPAYQMVRPGALLDVGLEVFFVESVSGPTDNVITATVVPGFAGSASANHASGTLAQINAAFTRWDIAQAVNQEILSLSAPDVGLGQIIAEDITYIPVYMAYDLGTSFDPLTSRVLEVNFKVPPPTRQYPQIRRGDYRVIRFQNPAGGDFPSGAGIIIYGKGAYTGNAAYPGFPIRVIFLSPFTPLVNLTDDLLTVGGIPLAMQDIVVMGAEVRLAADREIQRNDLQFQPDPRKAQEVPAGAIRGSTASLELRRLRRINEEVSRIKRAFPQADYR